MARLPFDPDRVHKPDVGGPAKREQRNYGSLPTERPLTVSQVTTLIKRVLADRTPSPTRVIGEVSNFSDRRHWYLSLKDEQDVLNCVMWKSAASRCGFTPSRGQQVVATGRLDYYGPQGRLQMYVDKLEPVGAGVLELKFRQLCDELRKAGYFADERKRPIPSTPRHIVIVTSANGAAVQDVIRTARQRWPGLRLSVIDVKVQGATAAPDIAEAIRAVAAERERLGIDALILTRGGGSLEDLWAFNERAVADAIRDCGVFVAAAIGHETDTTIAELVADLRCSTPTQAAMRLVPDATAETQRLDQLTGRLDTSLRRRAERARELVDAIAARPLFRRPAELCDRRRQSLEQQGQRLGVALRERLAKAQHTLRESERVLDRHDPRSRAAVARERTQHLTQRLAASMRGQIDQRRRALSAIAAQLKLVGPQSVLHRGFTYTTTCRGDLLRTARDAASAGQIVTHFADGVVESKVTGSKKDRTRSPKHQEVKSKTTKSRPKSRKNDPTSQLGLFDAH